MAFNSTERLNFWNCFFLSQHSYTVYKYHPLPLDNNGDVGNTTALVTKHLLQCRIPGAFITSSEAVGKCLSATLMMFIFLTCLLGVGTNYLNMRLLPKSFLGRRKHFRNFLLALSGVEFLLCVMAFGLTWFTLSIFVNVNRGQATVTLLVIFRIAFNFFRTVSVYMTMLLTVERYMVLAFPRKCVSWLTDNSPSSRWKSIVIITATLTFCFLINLPWTLTTTVVENDYQDRGHEYMDVLEFPYLIKKSEFGKQLNPLLQEILLALDFLVPFPLLLVLNMLLYKVIDSQRKAVGVAKDGTHERDVNAAKMFSVVVSVLLLFHIGSVVCYVTSRVQKVIYVELFLLQRLAVVLSTSSNFLIYYWFCSAFRREFWVYLNHATRNNCGWIKTKYYDNQRGNVVG